MKGSRPGGPVPILLSLLGCNWTPTIETANPEYSECFGVEEPSGPPHARLWDDVYTAYFGPGTPGHCGNKSCHGDQTRGRFLAGSTSASLYAGLVTSHLISPEDPANSLLLDRTRTPLTWFKPGAEMPLDNRVPNEAARLDITLWLTGTRCGLFYAVGDLGPGPDGQDGGPDAQPSSSD